MKKRYTLFEMLVQLIVAVLVFALMAVITKAIVNSDLPLWLKFFLLN